MDRQRGRLDDLSRRLSEAGRHQTRAWRDRLEAMDRLRATLGYEATLQRGYAVVRAQGHVITTLSAAAAAQYLEIQFQDGRLTVPGKSGSGAASQAEAGQAAITAPKPAPRKRATKKPPDTPDQGSLF